jgi:type VI protein secretion system component VasK
MDVFWWPIRVAAWLVLVTFVGYALQNRNGFPYSPQQTLLIALAVAVLGVDALWHLAYAVWDLADRLTQANAAGNRPGSSEEAAQKP